VVSWAHVNAGFSSLTFLKAQLLAEALRASTRYDAVILAIGQGVAAQFEKFCNRKFQRVASATFTCSADRDHVFLDRYPLESIAQVELRTDTTAGWVVQSGFVLNFDERTGKAYWGYEPAPHYAQLRFTFTGGFWWDITEEGNDELPSGATALDEDLRLAWILQCRIAWQAIDKIGQDITKTGSSSNLVTGTLGGLELLPAVKEILVRFRRMQLT